MSFIRLPCLLLFFFLAASAAKGSVVVSEIMYHPASGNEAEEFLELQNTGAAPVDISGWSISGGVDFVFPSPTILPVGGRIVVVADVASFVAAYPSVLGFVGDWSGNLSNATETIRLRNAAGGLACEITYADDGDWAQRRRDDPDHGHRGWEWSSGADGGGKSLELIQPAIDIGEGQNWAESLIPGGTPGAQNSVASSDLPCIIDRVEHWPVVPKSSDVVTVTCRVRDDHQTIVGVQLNHRPDGVAVFSQVPMFDDGVHGDGIAGDGVFGAFIPAASNGTRVEFFVSANDGASIRHWPAPAIDFDGNPVQSQNCIYQVDNEAYSGAMPLYRIVMKSADLQELAAINADTGVPPFPFGPGEIADQTHSHARFNATFISIDGNGRKIRYLSGVRNRGNGSRTATPPNFNVQFTNDNSWNDRTAIVLNSQNTPYQLLASILFRKAGLAGSESRAVRLRVNEIDPTSGSVTAPTYGFYVCNEFPDSDFASHHFPTNSGGNIYRGQRVFTGVTAGGTVLDGATLSRIVPAATEPLSLAELFAVNFRRETNSSDPNWGDIIGLTDALALGFNGATVDSPVSYASGYVQSVEATVNVRQWMRWLAVNTLADNEETNISNGDGDDYYIYFGKSDSRAVLLHHDLDTVLGRSLVSNSPTHGIFQMCDAPDGSPTALNPLMKHPDFAPVYYEELQRLLDDVFLPANFDKLCDQMLSPLVDSPVRVAIKTFNAARHAHVSTLLPRQLVVTAVQSVEGSTLSPVNGYPQTMVQFCRLEGRAPAVKTRSVRVNGAIADWSAWEAKWTLSSLSLSPGVNRILVQAFDENGAELGRTWQDVWYFDGDEEVRSGTLAASEVWTASSGPYRIAADINISAGVTLTIEPGTVVFASAGAGISAAAGAAIIAEGTESMPIRFMPAPGISGWDGIVIQGNALLLESRLKNVHISGNTGVAIAVSGARITLENVTFGNPAKPYLNLTNSSFVVADCIFPSPTSAFEMVTISGVHTTGVAVIRDCFFGRVLGDFDALDATGMHRPGPILHVVGNVFSGADDDILDLDSTDAWVEGNIFLNAQRDGSTGSSSAINSGGGNSHITVVGNIFSHCDNVATATDGNFMTLLSNTVVAQSGSDPGDALLNFQEPGTAAGAGMYLQGNLIHSATVLTAGLTNASTLTLNNNLLALPWTGPGNGNLQVDSLLTAPDEIPEPEAWNYKRIAEEIRLRLTPIPQSPARGAGANGTDLGGVRARGVSLSGAPAAISGKSSETFVAGTLMQGFGIPNGNAAFPAGSGWTHYRWRLDGGAWSAEVPLGQPLNISGYLPGVHILEVSGRTDGGLWQDDPALGGVPASCEWDFVPGFLEFDSSTVSIHEILALNSETVVFGTSAPDMVEFRNNSQAPMDVSGWGVSDSAANPFKYQFPAGTVIPPGGFFTLFASNSAAVPQPKTGFSIKREGDSLTLTRTDGIVVDYVQFGRQISDHSIGRAKDGSWALCKPTFGAENILAERAPVDSVVINEWLALASVFQSSDFIELHNRAVYPVDMGWCFLTDNPADWPDQYEIRPLTFIEPGGFVLFPANGDGGPLNLPFRLSSLQGEIALFSATGELLDGVVYGPQRADISEGLSPNGDGSIVPFSQPTPGGPNPGIVGTSSSSTMNVMSANHPWRFFANATSAPPHDGLGLPFTAPGYDDSAWSPAAQQLLFIETAGLSNTEGFSKTTLLPGINATRPFQTYYFRAEFEYNGPLTGAAVVAKVMCDDGANIYLNGGAATPVRMNAGNTAYSSRANTSVGDAVVQTIVLPASDLRVGTNVIAVSVHQFNLQSSGSTSTDVVWGMKLDVSATTAFPEIPVVLNEVLVSNTGLQNADGSFAGWVELYNNSPVAIDISDMSLSNDVTAPRKFIFPAGTQLSSNERRLVYFNPLLPVGAANTGWALNSDGGFLGFYHKPASGSALHQSVAFGRQIPNFSIARIPDGSGAWGLCAPTSGSLNVAAAIGQVGGVKINEWRSDSSDFIELFNTGTEPVDLSGCFLTDSTSARTRFPIPPLSFIGGSGASRWQSWVADGIPGAGHLNFGLQPGDSLALYTASETPIDVIPIIGTQSAGASGGRFVDGAPVTFELIPTPGTPNQLNILDGDGDGMPDSWELSFGLNPGFAGDGPLDSDGDGQSNLAEYFAGTNPNFSGDAFRAEMTPFSPSGPVIRFVAVAGKTYTVQFKTNLADPSWQRVGDVAPQPVTGVVEVPDPNGATAGQRFYRIVTPAVP